MAVAVRNEIEVVGRERLTPALEVAKKFTATSQVRPMLNHVSLKNNGEIHATDSHRAIILKNIHSYKEELLLNYKTLDLMKGYNYPDLASLVEVEKNLAASFELSKAKALDLIPALKFFKANKYQTVKFTFSQDVIELSAPGIHLKVDDFDFAIDQRLEVENTLVFTPSYLLDAFDAFIKFSINDNITVKFQGTMRPFILTNDEMTVAVLPRRVY